MRRIHLPAVSLGRVELPPPQAHYLRDVLRLTSGDAVEAFDPTGRVASGKLVIGDAGALAIEIESVAEAQRRDFFLSVAAAVPKSNRADWMIEKLSELGIAEFVPLITERGIVQPREGGKSDRWRRLAAEAARQSGRADVMSVQPPADLKTLLTSDSPRGIVTWQLSTRSGATPMLATANQVPPSLRLLIGPEGGWSPDEEALFESSGTIAVSLTPTTLRVETAAIAAAAVAMVWRGAFLPAAPTPVLTPARPTATIPPAAEKS
jgi:16S rRNA (uracil1498-N3)-methyltransferase